MREHLHLMVGSVAAAVVLLVAPQAHAVAPGESLCFVYDDIDPGPEPEPNQSTVRRCIAENGDQIASMTFTFRNGDTYVYFEDGDNFSQCDNRGEGQCTGSLGQFAQPLPPQSWATWTDTTGGTIMFISCVCQ